MTVTFKELFLYLILSTLWIAEGLQQIQSIPRIVLFQSHLSRMNAPRIASLAPFTRRRLADENSSEIESKKKSLVVAIDDLGQSLKPEAQKAKAKSEVAGVTTSQKILYSLLSYCYYTLFIFYRAYRGMFVLSPAIFRRVYSKLEEAIISDVVTENEIGNSSAVGDRVVSWRTKVTVSILAGIVTFSYFLGGFVRVAGKFLRTIANTTSASKSFEAAADEFLEHEGNIGGTSQGKTSGGDSPAP
jgi:hypothetical protein